MSSTLSRRAILAGAASASVIALPVVAAAAVPKAAEPELPKIAVSSVAVETDPIFAAIAEHRRLRSKRSALALMTTRPTTTAGATTLFVYTCKHRITHGEWHLAVLANAVDGAKQVNHADVDLFELGREALEVAAEVCRWYGPSNEADGAMIAWRKQNPSPDDPKALAAWKKKHAAAECACGYTQAEAAWSDACGALLGLTYEIRDFVVSTADGIEVKKAIISTPYERGRILNLDYEDEVADSIRRDLKHLKRLGVVGAVQS